MVEPSGFFAPGEVLALAAGEAFSIFEAFTRDYMRDPTAAAFAVPVCFFAPYVETGTLEVLFTAAGAILPLTVLLFNPDLLTLLV